MAALEIRGVRKRYSATQALLGIDLDVASGELLGLVGPSGCGKTTLLRCIAGLETLDDGSIAIAGRTVSTPQRCADPAERGIGFVFQDLALWPHLSALDHLRFVCATPASRKERTRQCMLALSDLHLDSLAARRPHELSGGERQRLAIARALMGNPKLLLLDEPLASLDPAIARDIRTLLRSLNESRGVTMIYVTHSHPEAFELAHRIAVMRSGRFLEVGEPEQLIRKPTSAYVAEFIGGAVLLEGERMEDRRSFRCLLGTISIPEEQRSSARLRLVAHEHDLMVCENGSGVHGSVVSSIFRGAHYTTRLRVNETELVAQDVQRRNPGESISVKYQGDPWFITEEAPPS